MSRHKRYPPEIRERAVRLVLEHQETYRSEWAVLPIGQGGHRAPTQPLRRQRGRAGGQLPLHR